MSVGAQPENGSRLDEFAIIERTGHGAFSDVCRARDGMGRDVVLKCPYEVVLGDTATFDRFRREMRIADRLDHPGIQRSLDQQAPPLLKMLWAELHDGARMRETHARECDARQSQDGQGMVEYALILVLIAVVVIVVLIVLGNQVLNVFSNISAGLGV
jgi:pilus assembly protein Flp/PilA